MKLEDHPAMVQLGHRLVRSTSLFHITMDPVVRIQTCAEGGKLTAAEQIRAITGC